MSSENDLLFRKFKLVPLSELPQQGSAHVVGQVERHLRKYDPTLRAMANTYIGMDEALHGKKKLTAKARLNLLNSNRARLLHMSRTDSQVANVPAGQVPQETVVAEQSFVERDVKSGYDEELKAEPKPTPLLAIPASSQGNFSKIMDLVAGSIEPGPDGEVVIEGKALPKTSFSDVMRAMFTDSKKTSVPGLARTVTELKRLGVPDTLLKAKKAKALYKAAAAGQTGSGRRIKKPKKLKMVGKAKDRKKYGKVLRLY